MSRPVVMVSGMVAGTPGQGGASWAILQYLLGLRRLGYDPVLVEPVDRLDEATVSYCREVMDRFGFTGRWSLVERATGATCGMDRTGVVDAARAADLLLNVSGMLEDTEILDCISVRVYLDLDPAFIQLWHAVEGIDMRFDAHTHFVTVADSIGEQRSTPPPIPSCGRHWIPTLPPVALDEWPVAERLVHDALTTVGHWRGYGSIHHGGVHYGQKAHSLRPLMDLPRRTDMRFLLALAIDPGETDDLEALHAHGWDLVDPATVASTPDAYRSFVQGSRGEFGIAKSGYVASDSGWFSDRSACYLASGRPVLAQHTGFDRRLPTGKGLFSFRQAGDVVAAIDELRADDAGHRSAAREIAREYLDADRVLPALLDRISSSG